MKWTYKSQHFYNFYSETLHCISLKKQNIQNIAISMPFNKRKVVYKHRKIFFDNNKLV